MSRGSNQVQPVSVCVFLGKALTCSGQPWLAGKALRALVTSDVGDSFHEKAYSVLPREQMMRGLEFLPSQLWQGLKYG